ncbi:hypothetical protein [Streptomyces sp. NBC_00503]|uniref:hypothetical protein n=1 Tax=Streptomyces sp. NBC_00503 TaxID=2903659 RepID=UPI002E815BFD|nr:hypothetical protein [Streptomyces sp. NBC_00503]WUD83333.1 hypothetical protein OG490_23800 [Streptomyces sp. NBC_00503]
MKKALVPALAAFAAHHKSPAVAVFAHNWNGFGYYGLMNEVSAAINNLAQSGAFVAVSEGNPMDADWLFPAANQRYAVENPPANASQALVVMGTMPDDTTVGAVTDNPLEDAGNTNTFTPNRLLNTGGL